MYPGLQTAWCAERGPHGLPFKGEYSFDMSLTRWIISWLTIAVLIAGEAAWAGQATDPAELERTWLAAKVFLPKGTFLRDVPLGTEVRDAPDLSSLETTADGSRLPLIIYMHACSGFGGDGYDAGRFFASKGHAVIAPDSFARQHKPLSCDPDKLIGSLHRDAVKFRVAEAGYAIRKARGFPWVDQERFFLIGWSEGAIATAKFSGEPLTARVIEGWHCQAGDDWSDNRGLDAPSAEPVLALLASEDPWFKPFKGESWFQGDCGRFMSKTNGSRSFVFEEIELRYSHSLLWNDAVRRLVLAFLEGRYRDLEGPVDVDRLEVLETSADMIRIKTRASVAAVYDRAREHCKSHGKQSTPTGHDEVNYVYTFACY